MTAPPTVVSVDGGMKDFSSTRKPVQFTVDGDVFTGPAEVAAEELIAYGEKFDANAPPRGQLDGLKDLLEIFLWDDDYKRICERLGNRRSPISLEQLDNICNWLTEYHGMRPTQPPSDSSSLSSSPESGTDSTVSLPLGESIPAVSLSPDS